VAQVGRREHGAAAVRPADHADALGVDVGAVGEVGDRAERVEAAVGLRHAPRAVALGAELLLVARRQRVDDERVHAEAVEELGVLAHAAAERAALGQVAPPPAVETLAIAVREGGAASGEVAAAKKNPFSTTGAVAGTVDASGTTTRLLGVCQRRRASDTRGPRCIAR
jgi:hypothetical protein